MSFSSFSGLNSKNKSPPKSHQQEQRNPIPSSSSSPPKKSSFSSSSSSLVGPFFNGPFSTPIGKGVNGNGNLNGHRHGNGDGNGNGIDAGRLDESTSSTDLIAQASASASGLASSPANRQEGGVLQGQAQEAGLTINSSPKHRVGIDSEQGKAKGKDKELLSSPQSPFKVQAQSHPEAQIQSRSLPSTAVSVSIPTIPTPNYIHAPTPSVTIPKNTITVAAAAPSPTPTTRLPTTARSVLSKRPKSKSTIIQPPIALSPITSTAPAASAASTPELQSSESRMIAPPPPPATAIAQTPVSLGFNHLTVPTNTTPASTTSRQPSSRMAPAPQSPIAISPHPEVRLSSLRMNHHESNDDVGHNDNDKEKDDRLVIRRLDELEGFQGVEYGDMDAEGEDDIEADREEPMDFGSIARREEQEQGQEEQRQHQMGEENKQGERQSPKPMVSITITSSPLSSPEPSRPVSPLETFKVPAHKHRKFHGRSSTSNSRTRPRRSRPRRRTPVRPPNPDLEIYIDPPLLTNENGERDRYAKFEDWAEEDWMEVETETETEMQVEIETDVDDYNKGDKEDGTTGGAKGVDNHRATRNEQVTSAPTLVPSAAPTSSGIDTQGGGAVEVNSNIDAEGDLDEELFGGFSSADEEGNHRTDNGNNVNGDQGKGQQEGSTSALPLTSASNPIVGQPTMTTPDDADDLGSQDNYNQSRKDVLDNSATATAQSSPGITPDSERNGSVVLSPLLDSTRLAEQVNKGDENNKDGNKHKSTTVKVVKKKKVLRVAKWHPGGYHYQDEEPKGLPKSQDRSQRSYAQGRRGRRQDITDGHKEEDLVPIITKRVRNPSLKKRQAQESGISQPWARKNKAGNGKGKGKKSNNSTDKGNTLISASGRKVVRPPWMSPKNLERERKGKAREKGKGAEDDPKRQQQQRVHDEIFRIDFFGSKEIRGLLAGGRRPEQSAGMLGKGKGKEKDMGLDEYGRAVDELTSRWRTREMLEERDRKEREQQQSNETEMLIGTSSAAGVGGGSQDAGSHPVTSGGSSVENESSRNKTGAAWRRNRRVIIPISDSDDSSDDDGWETAEDYRTTTIPSRARKNPAKRVDQKHKPGPIRSIPGRVGTGIWSNANLSKRQRHIHELVAEDEDGVNWKKGPSQDRQQEKKKRGPRGPYKKTRLKQAKAQLESMFGESKEQVYWEDGSDSDYFEEAVAMVKPSAKVLARWNNNGHDPHGGKKPKPKSKKKLDDVLVDDDGVALSSSKAKGTKGRKRKSTAVDDEDGLDSDMPLRKKKKTVTQVKRKKTGPRKGKVAIRWDRPSGATKISVESNVARKEINGRRPWVESSTCHQCRIKTTKPKLVCPKPIGECGKLFCDTCLEKKYPGMPHISSQAQRARDVRASRVQGQPQFEASFEGLDACPKCTGVCNCASCRRDDGGRKGTKGTKGKRKAIDEIENGGEGVVEDENWEDISVDEGREVRRSTYGRKIFPMDKMGRNGSHPAKRRRKNAPTDNDNPAQGLPPDLASQRPLQHDPDPNLNDIPVNPYSNNPYQGDSDDSDFEEEPSSDEDDSQVHRGNPYEIAPEPGSSQAAGIGDPSALSMSQFLDPSQPFDALIHCQGGGFVDPVNFSPFTQDNSNNNSHPDEATSLNQETLQDILDRFAPTNSTNGGDGHSPFASAENSEDSLNANIPISIPTSFNTTEALDFINPSAVEESSPPMTMTDSIISQHATGSRSQQRRGCASEAIVSPDIPVGSPEELDIVEDEGNGTNGVDWMMPAL